jgi:bifunctional ADP-heptose synthase (sugar kinase/adenylyltransferase)
VSEDERVQMLTHVRHVDYVTIKQLSLPKWHLIKQLKPDVLVATAETYTPEQVKELKKYCGKVVVLEPQAITSTTAKIRRLNIGLSSKIQKAVKDAVDDAFRKIVDNG